MIKLNGCIFWLIEDYDLMEKGNTIWDKVSSDIKKQFDTEPVYNKYSLKIKIKSYLHKTTNFYDKEIPKVIIL